VQPLGVLGQQGRQVGQVSTPVSYVVLGLVARDGPSTPYALKTAVGRGVAHFWPFPHSQIYAETERLARMGLLAEEREHTGRRRRSYRITGDGRAELHRRTVELTAEIIERLRARGDRPGQLAVAQLMGDSYRVMAEHWERIGRAAADLPGPVGAGPGS
jgi:DNA-binding PadR family transcriptional regulator